MDPPIKVLSISQTEQNETWNSIVPFTNVPFDEKHTLVTEIILIHISNLITDTLSEFSGYLARGQSAPTEIGGTSTIVVFGSPGAQGLNNSYPVVIPFNDGAGNGLLVPENALFLYGVTGAGIVKIYYKMRLVENEDLLMYFANYRKGVNS